MRATGTALQRAVDGLDRRMTEDLQALRHELDLELNTRKDDTRAGMKAHDMAAEELNNKFTISLGALRTEIESAKWEATRRAIAIIIALVICGVAVSTFTSTLTTPGPPPLPKVTAGQEPAAGGADARSPAPPPPAHKKAAEYRDAAVGTDDDGHFDDELERLHDQLDELLDKEWPPERAERPERVEKVVEKKSDFPERI